MKQVSTYFFYNFQNTCIRLLLILWVGLFADDMEDGIRFVYEKFAEYVEKQFPERCNGVRSVLQRLLEVVPPK